MAELTARLKLRLAENLVEELDKSAAENGLNRSEYLRLLIRTTSPIPFPKTDLSRYIREVKEIGLIVNQFTVRAHKQSFVAIKELSSCMQRLKKLLDAFFDLYAERRFKMEIYSIRSSLIPKGEEQEINIRLTEEEKEKLKVSAEKSKLSQKSYLTLLIEGIRPTEKPSCEYWNFVREVRSIDVNMNLLYMRSITIKDPAQNVLYEYHRVLQKAVSALVHNI